MDLSKRLQYISRIISFANSLNKPNLSYQANTVFSLSHLKFSWLNFRRRKWWHLETEVWLTLTVWQINNDVSLFSPNHSSRHTDQPISLVHPKKPNISWLMTVKECVWNLETSDKFNKSFLPICTVSFSLTRLWQCDKYLKPVF